MMEWNVNGKQCFGLFAKKNILKKLELTFDYG